MAAVKTLFVTYWSGIEYILLALLLVAALPAYRLYRSGNVIAKVSVWLGALVVVAYACEAVSYVLTPNYFDYAEPMMVVMASNLMHGGDLYQNWDTGGGVVGSLYGPLGFLIQSVFLTLSGSIWASKAPGLVFALGALWLSWMILPRQLAWRTRFAVFTLFVATLALYGVTSFWNRPDPVILFIVCLAALVSRQPPGRALLGLAIAMGLLGNLKPHAPMYVAPFLLPALIAIKEIRPRIIATAAVGVATLFVFLLPFMAPRISLGVYLEILLMAGKHGLLLHLVLQAIALSCVLVGAPAVLLWRSGSGSDRLLCAGAVIASLIVSIASAKPGGGAYHILPFAPVGMTMLARAWSNGISEQASLRVQAFATVVVIAISPIFTYNWWKLNDLFPDRTIEIARGSEATTFLRDFPGSEIGVGSSINSASQKLRVFAGLNGRVVSLDVVNWQDLRLADQPVDLVVPLLQGCRVPAWLMPNGEAEFSALGARDIDLFDERFRRLFRTNYEVRRTGDFYVVWACKDNIAAKGASSSLATGAVQER